MRVNETPMSLRTIPEFLADEESLEFASQFSVFISRKISDQESTGRVYTFCAKHSEPTHYLLGEAKSPRGENLSVLIPNISPASFCEESSEHTNTARYVLNTLTAASPGAARLA